MEGGGLLNYCLFFFIDYLTHYSCFLWVSRFYSSVFKLLAARLVGGAQPFSLFSSLLSIPSPPSFLLPFLEEREKEV